MFLQRRNLQDSVLQANNGLQELAPATQESAGQLLAGKKWAAGTDPVWDFKTINPYGVGWVGASASPWSH